LINSAVVPEAVSFTALTTAIASLASPIGPLISDSDTSNPAIIGAEDMTFHSSGL
jgi:hypothetical protein